MTNTNNLFDYNNMKKNIDKFYNFFSKRYIKKGTKSYFKLINSHNYNIYVRKNIIKNCRKVVKEIKNKNKNCEIKWNKYIEPKNESNVENKLINNDEIEFKFRSKSFKYKDKSYFTDFENLGYRSETRTFEIRKFNGIPFNYFVDITRNPIKKILINDFLVITGIKFDIAVKVKYYKWKQVNNEYIIKKWLPRMNTKNITIINACTINMNNYYDYLLEKLKDFWEKVWADELEAYHHVMLLFLNERRW